jgi:hypothetical protein
MSNINTLSSGYKSHPTKVQSTNTRIPVADTSKKIDYVGLVNRIKIWHADGVLTTDGVNYIISQLQKIV